MPDQDDFLDEIIAERTKSDPDFPRRVEAAIARRELLDDLACRRAALGLSQKEVAARMATSQSALARLESGEVDPKLSTVARYAMALGLKLEWRVGEWPNAVPTHSKAVAS